MLDTRSAFNDVLRSADDLLSKARTRVETSKVAKAAQGPLAERVSALSEAVAETQANAKNAMAKLAEAEREKRARREEKVALAVHIATVASRLMA